MTFIKGHPQYNSGKTHFKKGFTPWNKGKANWVKYICKICDSEFIRKASPSRIGRNKYCSRECQNKIGNLNLQRIGAKPTGLNLPKCLDCGKILTNYHNKYCKSHAHTGGRSYSWKGGKQKYYCIDCKTEIASFKALRCSDCNGFSKRGENSPHWRGGSGTERHILMTKKEYILWRIAVFMRDDYTCQVCNKRGCELQADHIKPWALYPELRYAIDNGRTLCVSCHRQTDTWGRNSIYRQERNLG